MYSEINFTKVGINIKMFRAARHITQMELGQAAWYQSDASQ